MHLSFHQVTKRYGAVAALDHVDLEVAHEGGTLVLIGPSGGGKSTFLRVLAGLTIPDSGRVSLDGEEVVFEPRALLAHRRRHGFVFQSWNLFPHLSARENIVLPLVEVHGMGRGRAEAVAEQYLERFSLGAHGAKRPAEMSGGQQQRVALARALAPSPRLLLLDEPTSALDPEMTAEVLDVLSDVCRSGQDIVLSTHEMGFARRVAKTVVFLAEGRVLDKGAPETIFEGGKTTAAGAFLERVMRY